ncbi:glycosyltransferase family 4 protein [Methylobacterium terricola]|uniref:Glycosyltransferase family 4 protein n=1 Tax=Methylobacterium terricola TaxID=2583531 RepID=A0A5C4LE07_9HYPH|nr:glycosyltransferase family 4 protein [Methylobacterium terricola]TNC10799.1 glycosyltransferase family 4 protein [Methylobacterium terricola]
MKVILVADHAYINGGQAKVSLESAIGLARRGHEVVLFAAVGPADPRLAEAGVRVVLLGQTDVTQARSLARFGVQWLWNAAAAAQLRDLIAASDPRDTVVHVHAWAKALSPSIGPVLRGSAAPVVYTAHEYYLACPNGGFYDYPVAAACHRVPNGPACLTHNCDSRTYPRKLMRVARHALMRRTGLVEGIDAMITISRLQRDALAPYLPARMRFYDVPNPVDAAPLGHRAGAPGDFVFVGRLSPEKGPGLFGDAARLAGARAVFAGDGPMRAELEARFPEASFLGWQSPDQVKAVLRAARALVFPSVWYEGQPLTVLESLALGTPVLVSDVCAGREAVRHGESGLWFRSNDPRSLADAMAHLANDATAMRMGRAAYDLFWADPLTMDRHLDGLERVYRDVSGQGEQARPLARVG